MTDNLKITMLAMLAALGLQAFADNSVAYRLNPTAEVEFVGTGKIESYDIAIRIDDPSLVGCKITGVSVPVPDVDAALLGDCSVWLTKELTLDSRKKNVPDIASADAVPQSGILAADFAEPYTITDAGVYVGYSINVKVNGPKQPLAVTAGTNPGGFYWHTSLSYRKWADYGESLGGSSALQVNITGNFADNSVGIGKLSELNVKAGAESTFDLPVVNHGAMPVASIGYKIAVDGKTSTGEVSLDKPLPNLFGCATTIPVTIPAVDKGQYSASVEITTVNGQPNIDGASARTIELTALAALPVNRPLMEEYTGLWCGWCPRGWVALEMMNDLYPDDFVCVSYHNSDPMEMKYVNGRPAYPTQVDGYPSAMMNRTLQTDPYYGETNQALGIEQTWKQLASDFVPVEINVSGEWKNEKEVAVTADVMFVKPVSEIYKIEFVLLANKLSKPTDPNWLQSNYYPQYQQYLSDPNLAWCVTAGSKVAGLEFNDVAILNTGNLGVEQSLPDAITVENQYSYTHTFDVTKALNTSDEPIADNYDSLSAVAIVIMRDGSAFGKVINSNKCKIGAPSGIIAIDNDAARVSSVEYYDLSGRRVDNPAGGLFIKKATYTDGRTATSKVIMK